MSDEPSCSNVLDPQLPRCAWLLACSVSRKDASPQSSASARRIPVRILSGNGVHRFRNHCSTSPEYAGHSRTDIARFLKVSRTSVNKWVSNFLLHGVAGLDSVRPPGRPAKLGAEQLSQLSEYIDQQSRLAIGGRLQGTDIQTYIEREFGVAYELSNVYRLLRELGFSWITSRSRHPKQDGQVQEAFKKLPAGNDP